MCTPKRSLWSSLCTTPTSTSSALSRWCSRPQALVCRPSFCRHAIDAQTPELLSKPCPSTRGLPVPQRASECASLPGHRWPSHLCHDLRGHLLPLYHILHVCPGMKVLNLEFTTATCCFCISHKLSSARQGKLIKQHRWAYFKSKWNLLELAIILLSWSALSVFIKRTLLGKRDIEYYQNNKDQ